jgi:ubiquitin-like modifier-activating enzyme ATG7
MTPLQFQPISSQPTAAFWSALTALKLDKLKLDDAEVSITAWLEQGKEVRDKEVKAGEGSRTVGVDGVLGVGSAAFGGEGERSVASRWKR